MPVETPEQALAAVQRLHRHLSSRGVEVRRRDDYYRGRQPLAFASERWREFHADRYRGWSDNWCAVVADSVSERLRVNGIRLDADATSLSGGESRLWRWWQANDLDAQSSQGFLGSTVAARSAVIVWDDGAGDGIPSATWEPASHVIVAYDTEDRRRRVAALKAWRDADDDTVEHATLYTPQALWKFSRRVPDGGWAGGDGGWVPRETGGEPWPLPNPLRVVPVVEFPNRPMLDGHPVSDIAGVMAMQDAVNLLWAYLFNAADFASFPQRVVMGQEPPKVPILDESGQVVGSEPVDLKKLAQDRLLWLTGQNTSIGSWPAADLAAYTNVVEVAVGHIAAQTRTPQHYLIGKMANLPLALDTPVPTASGMRTMGTVEVGDRVFAPDGTPATVTALSPVWLNRECFRVTFDDGTEIVADGDHLWTASRFVHPGNPYRRARKGRPLARRETVTVTTREIAGSLLTSMGTRNWFIPVAAGLDGPDAALPIEPYALGAWLGDGDRVNGVITAHVDDAPHIVTALRSGGSIATSRPMASHDPDESRWLISIRHDRDRCPRGHERPRGTKKDTARCPECAHLAYLSRRDGVPMPAKTNVSFQARMKGAGVWRRKHIPESYFQASRAQRLELLRGLMDTDGSVNRRQGSVKLAFHHERLARDAHRLIQSLGHKCRLVVKTARHKVHGDATVYVMTWSAPDVVFHLPRKALLQRTEFGGGDGRSNSPLRRYVVSVEPVLTVPVRCITVDHPSHLFCVTHAFVATHNSADALKAAETGLVKKAQEAQLFYSSPVREVMALMAQVAGDDVLAAAARTGRVLWADPESRSEAQLVDALLKLQQIGFPFEFLAARYGLSPAEIAELVEQRDGAAARILAGDMSALDSLPAPGATTGE